MSHLLLERLHLRYGAAPAVADLNLEVKDGELVSLLGPSGCGKTTTMRAVAGLLAPSSGRILLAGQDITHLPPNKRDIGLVFQSYALFPHLSAFENVAFGLRLRRVQDSELRRRVGAALDVVGLSDLADRLPANLSGGQQQRVALARAFVIEPRLLLLDEPLSNLDAKLRLDMRGELRRIQRELGVTMLYVTHDQDEALALSDRIVIMRAGRIEQQGTPEEVYARPSTPFVADFMGWQNILAAAAVPDALRRAHPAATHFAWRPETVTLGHGTTSGRVLARTYQGEHLEYLLESPLGRVKAFAPTGAAWSEGSEVTFELSTERAAALRDA
ncbi:MAG: transporter ATP-binding protein [Deinococcus sp.]|nr:transporter ATP-binding protein [Deinococcus sp.]